VAKQVQKLAQRLKRNKYCARSEIWASKEEKRKEKKIRQCDSDSEVRKPG
jgi:hypothetical protein